MVFSLLWGWSLRRVRVHLKTWVDLARLTFDWITLLYFYLPAAALLVHLLILYYQERWIPAVQQTPTSFAILRAIVAVIAVILSLVLHLMVYGKATFSLEHGDRLYVMLSPLRKRTLLTAIWLEGAVLHVSFGAIVFALTQPVLGANGVPAAAWLAFVLLTCLMLNTMRIPSALWLQRGQDGFLWTALRRLIAFVTWFPFVVSVGLVVSNHWPWGVAVLAVLAVAWFAAFARFGARLAWDPLFTFRMNMIFGRVARDDASRVLWRRRIPTQWLIGMCERWIVRRPLNPLTWLVVTRSLRQRGVVRVWWVLTAGVIAGMRLPPWPVIKFICFAFFALLFLQWCRTVFRPLYAPFIDDQGWVDRWALQVSAQNLLMTTVVANLVLWFVLSAGLNLLTPLIHIPLLHAGAATHAVATHAVATHAVAGAP